MILPYAVSTNVVWSDMCVAWTLMDSVASGRKPMQLICSAPGFGKTTKAKERFRRNGIVSEEELYRSLPPLPEISATSFPSLPPAMLKSRPQSHQTAMRRAVMGMPPFEHAKRRLFIEARPTKPISLVRTLHQCTMLQAAALLFDDPGRIAGDEAACDILKTAFGMQRRVTFETPEITRNENRRISGHGGYDPFLPAPDFPVPADLRWLWLTNTNFADPAVLARLGDHFAALIARGLNPFWMRDDAEHDHHDLFLCVYHLATEENLLRSMGFPYEVSRKAVNFYVTHADRLVDLCPRRLELLAQEFAADQSPTALEAALNAMAPFARIRPKLRLPASWVSAPNGVLLWPEQPFSKTKPPVEGNPPRRIRRREREYKRLHEGNQSASRTPAGTPDPEPPPPVAMQPVEPDLEPDPDPAAATSAPIPVEAETSKPINPPPVDPRERKQQMHDVGEDVDREGLGQIVSRPGLPSDPELAPTIQEPPIKDSSPDVVERNCGRDAILDMVLPPGDSRQGAFLGAVEQMKAMGENVDEPVLVFIRRVAIRPDRASKLFEPDTAREIINQAKAMMAWFGPIDSVRDPDPATTIHRIANASGEETAEITRRYDLRAFRGPAGKLDVVAYRRRAAFLNLAGPRLTSDQVAIVRMKPKGFWQEQGAAERWLTEMLDLSARGDVPQESNDKPEERSEDGKPRESARDRHNGE